MGKKSTNGLLGDNSQSRVMYNKNSDNGKIQCYVEAGDWKSMQVVEKILKKHGFRWSSHNKCWQRNLTDDGVIAAERVMEELKDMEG